jgi:hypothetical protein
LTEKLPPAKAQRDPKRERKPKLANSQKLITQLERELSGGVPLEVYFSCAAVADKLELAKGFEPPTL